MLAALQTLAQTYDYSFDTLNASNNDPWWAAMFGGAFFFIWLIVLVATVAGMWKAFEKAKQPGWAAIVPIYNMVVLLQIAGRPVWWILLFIPAFIPFVGLLVALALAAIIYNDVSKSFGQGMGTTILLVLLPVVGWPMLGFGDAKYKGPAGPVKSK